MSTSAPIADSSLSLFTSGRIVVDNPKETGVIFAIVVILSVLLENVFGAFRENRSRYVKLLFTQVSEEIMIVGAIGLIFVFIVQSVDNLPPQWIMIFRWTTTVLFFMMTFFVLGIVIVAGVTTNVINRLKRFEAQVQDQGIELGDGLDLSRTQRGFLTFRSLYLKQIKFLAKKAKPGSLEAEVESIPFSKYLEARTRNTLVKFTDVTWQCWLSLLFASSANSVRMFLLPASSQSPGADAYQRLVNHGTFIAILGWIPFLIFLVAVFLLFRRNADYVQSVNASQVTSSESGAGAPTRAGNRSGGASHGGASVPLLDVELGGDSGEGATSKADKVSNVWLPPKQLAGELVGELCEDPSVYLLRSNRGFTLHILKIPTIMIEFYFSIFVVGMWGEMSTKLGLNQIGLLPFALLPVLIIFCFLPHALLVVTVLTSLGCRLDEKELKRLVLRKELKANAHGSAGGGGGEGDEDGEAEEEEKLNERNRDAKGAAANGKSDGQSRNETGSEGALLQLPDRHGSVGSESIQSQELQSKLALLRLHMRYLEALCGELGVPSGDIVLDDEQLRELQLEEESGVSTDAPEQFAALVVDRLQRTEGQESASQGRRFGLAAAPPPLRHAGHGRFSSPDQGAPHPRHIPLPLRLGIGGLGGAHPSEYSNSPSASRVPGSPRPFGAMDDQRGRSLYGDPRGRSGMMDPAAGTGNGAAADTANSMAMLQAVASARQLAANNGAFLLSSKISRRPTVQASALDNIHRAANL